ncbi:MAG: hypothetical protein V4488_06985 [Pseudomonadota bacterium]
MKTTTKSLYGAIAATAAPAAIAAMLLFTPAVSAQDADKLALAKKLVEQAQLHKMATLGMQLSVRRVVAEGKASQEFLACVSAAEPGAFSAGIASLYADRLSILELKDALKFFESQAGRKYTAYTFWGTEKYAGFAPSTPAVAVTVDEKQAIDAFIASPVGRKMSGTGSSFATATQRETLKVIGPLLAACKSST